jgi:hypothetical protein
MVLIAVIMKITDAMYVIYVYIRLEGTCALHLQGRRVKLFYLED